MRLAIPAISWLESARIEFAVLLPGHPIWEIAHLPMYALWYVALWTQIAFEYAHYAACGLLIGMSALALAADLWPQSQLAAATFRVWTCSPSRSECPTPFAYYGPLLITDHIK